RAPAARGEGPTGRGWVARRASCSPRTWGWSGDIAVGALSQLVLPTHVGMVLRERSVCPAPTRAPHARGDGPPGNEVQVRVAECSPRTWGWPALQTGSPA